METYFLSVALVIALAGAVWDIATRRIPNLLTYSGLGTAIAVRAALAGWRAAGNAAAAVLLSGGVFLLFYLVQGMGAGDVKLIAAVCAWAGWQQSLEILLATGIAGGVLALGYALYGGRLGQTCRNLGALALFHLRRGMRAHPQMNLSNNAAIRMPYAVAIAAGALYSWGAVLAGR